MGQFFAKDFTGAPFELFGPAHLVALAIVFLIILSIPYFRDHSSPRARTRFRYTLAAILIVNEFLWHLWNFTTGQWTLQTMLPLHLCSVLVWVSAYMLVAKNYNIYEFAYFLGIAGALQALLTPDAGQYGFPHFRFFQTIISHGSIITAAVYMTVVEGFRPTLKSLQHVIVYGNLYMLAVGAVNYLIGSNYLFIMHKPETASLLDLLGPWPWYILVMEMFALVLCLLLYLPFALKDRRALISSARAVE
jgi:hypothetical integral membrane protein (TIGR02206 family)